MAAPNPRLADLSDDDRQVVESWLIEFDQRWDEGILAGRVDQIPPGSSWRLPALVEMVKIDLERQWQHGRRVSLESYLAQFPELGRPENVSADLIQAEYEVRREFGAPAALEDYLRRFPHQAAELARLIGRGESSARDNEPRRTSPQIPATFGRYTIIKRLGQGGMGSVYLAEDTHLGRRVALKVPDFGPHEGPEARQRFLDEARTAATLDHPSLCPVFDAGEIDGRLYLTMAYIQGQSLAALIGNEGWPERQVAALVGKLALAMQEAHARKVIHRDLKPANVMIKTTGPRREPVIVDFGLAHRDNPEEVRLTRSGQIMGTLGYMSPEQIRGDQEEIGPACDIYALGVILYELLTGRLPFNGSGLAVAGQILTRAPLHPSTHRSGLNPALEAICLKAMAKAIRDRYTSMGEMAAALTDYLRSPSSTSGQPRAGGTLSDKGTNTLTWSSADSLPPALAAHPDYEIKRELGRGGMGVVYLAHNTLMGRDEVLKVMGEHLMGDPGVLERFLREIRSVATLRHPNIVTAYHASRFGPSVIFAMEYVEGLDLSRLVNTKGPTPVAHGCLFIHQAALGLQHAYEKGLVHRDIKPHNLMLSREGNKATVKILDFGLAKAAREEKVEGGVSLTGQALGSPDYIAPEQIIDAQSADIRADIYSLGGTLYYLLTGHPPFQEKSLYDLYQAHISRLADPLNLVRPEVPAGLAALVAKMMAKDPSQRFQTPGEVAQALKPFCTKVNASSQSPTVTVSQAGRTNSGRTVAEAASAATQLETDADRRILGAKKTADSSAGESRWESMIDLKGEETSTDEVADAAPRRSSWVWPSVAVGVLMLGLFAAWMGGVFKFKTPDGTGMIVLENVPKDSEILVDGDKFTFAWPGSGKPVEVRAVPGQHKVEVKKDGFSTFVKEATFKTEGSEEVTVRLEPLVVDRPGKKEAGFLEATADKAPELKTEVVVSRPENAIPSGPTMITNSLGMNLVPIPAGDFEMGSPHSDKNAADNEKPQHQVRITRPFYLGATEVTVGQFRCFVEKTGYRTEAETNGRRGNGWDEATATMYRNPKYTWRSPGYAQTDDHPVANVSWNDTIAFCNKLSELEGLKPYSQAGAEAPMGGAGYRLPTEAEWEYACRAGSTTRNSSGDDPESLGEYAWILGNSYGKTHPVGQKRPNAFGLYDMLGNVWEWCWDVYESPYDVSSPRNHPFGHSQARDRVFRGGSWLDNPRDVRSALRRMVRPDWSNLNHGFRVARAQSMH